MNLYRCGAMALFAVANLIMSSPGAANPAANPHDMVARTLDALGWKRDVRKLTSVRMSAAVVSYDVVENDHAGPPHYLLGIARETVTDDLRNGRQHSVATSQPTGLAPSTRTIHTLNSRDIRVVEVAIGGKHRTLTLPTSPGWEVRNPVWALLLAERAPDLARESDTTLHGALQYVVAFKNRGYRVRILIDASTILPSAVEATVTLHRADSADIAWNAWGDVVERTEYINWRLRDGVRYPMQWDVFRNDALARTVSISKVEFNVPIDAAQFATPKAAEQAAAGPPLYADDLSLGQPVSRAPDPKRPIKEIAPGIVQIPNSWYVTLVRQDDGIVVIDAPISAGYSKRVLAEAARRYPGAPVKAVITSTAFYWHIAGIREYAARGIPIYVRDRNVPIVRRLLAAPHTLVPDDLARHPKAPVIRAVSERTTIGHGTNAIVLWPIRYATQPMLMTYIPDAHLLHTAEMVQPLGPNGSILFPESLIELKYSVRDAKIPTDHLTLIGMHMSPTPWTAIGKTLRAAAQ